MAKLKNIIFITLLGFLFIEILIVFPSRLEHENEAEVRARVEAQRKAELEKKERQRRGEKVAEPQKMAEQKLSGFQVVESQQGTRDWELQAQSAEGSQEQGNFNLHQVKILFYNKEKLEFTVTGDSGRIDSTTKDISVAGNVITRSENGYVFKSPSIFYNTKTRIIDSPENIEMTGPREGAVEGIQLKGRQMKVLVDEAKMFIKQKVIAEKPSQGGKKFQIASDAAEFNGKSSEAKFTGSVKIKYDGMQLEGPDASFLYDKKTNFLSSIDVHGGVKVSDADKLATSENVQLDLLADRYIFKGRPRVVQNNDELIGEEIVFLEGGKKVKVERVRARVENKEQ